MSSAVRRLLTGATLTLCASGIAPVGAVEEETAAAGAVERLRLSPRTFYGQLNRVAAGYTVWGARRLDLGDAEELESRADEISWAAQRIVARAGDDLLGRRFEDLLARSATVTRARHAIDTYTAVTLRSGGPSLGAEVETAAKSSEPRAGSPLPRRAPAATARLQVDLHPKLILKSRLGTSVARLEVPLSRSECRLTLSWPLGPHLTSELFAAIPRRGEGDPRAGVHFFLAF